ncbi:fasciclin domain-containing protein [Kitasatospora sp. NPDC002965]|uniref:fasciclin domain-containing protein n=1 Tax=Kitasatospora sp. NPDC002965 TaxID=3154775 RepID=UPI00339F8BA0
MSAPIKTAEAGDVLDPMDDVTVFAPNDAAFAKLPGAVHPGEVDGGWRTATGPGPPGRPVRRCVRECR